MAHVTPVRLRSLPGPAAQPLQRLWAQSTCVDDWNADNFDHAGLGFIGGGMLTAPHELKPIAVASDPLRRGSRAGARPGRRGWADTPVARLGGAQIESLSYEGNRLDLDPVAKDPYGVPVVRVTHRVRENERAGLRLPAREARAWLREAGASETWSRRTSPSKPATRNGGTRMGDDPDSSVVDRFGFSHEAPNLGVHRRLDLPDDRRAQSDAHRSRRSPGGRRSTWSTLGRDRTRDKPAWINMKSDIFARSVFRERDRDEHQPGDRSRGWAGPAEHADPALHRGPWQDASDGGTFDVVAPASEEHLATVAAATADDVERGGRGRPRPVRRRRVVAADGRRARAFCCTGSPTLIERDIEIFATLEGSTSARPAFEPRLVDLPIRSTCSVTSPAGRTRSRVAG